MLDEIAVVWNVVIEFDGGNAKGADGNRLAKTDNGRRAVGELLLLCYVLVAVDVDSELGIFGGILSMVSVGMRDTTAYYVFEAVVDGAFHVSHFAARFKQEDFSPCIECVAVSG
jgi:hypothetical protein